MHRRPWSALVGLGLLGLSLVACGSDGDDGEAGPTGLQVPDGYVVEQLVDGLDGPTQLQVLDDGRLLVAHLNGTEGEPDGQVLAIDPASGEREVVVDGLVSPTGVAVIGDDLWVMEQRRLSLGSLASGDLEVVLDELPFNGRSEGTLTPLADGRLVYHTSGSISSGRASEGSGAVWVLDAAAVAEGADPDPQLVVAGFKNAYARVVGPDGTLWQAEVADGSFDGEQAPDELVAVPADALESPNGADAGWPRCIGDRQPVAQFDGTGATCASTLGAHALFPSGATPTSVVVSPWDDDVLLVALWVEGEIVAVPMGGTAPVEVTTWGTGIERPQHLVADGDRLLVVDHESGQIFAVTQQ